MRGIVRKMATPKWFWPWTTRWNGHEFDLYCLFLVWSGGWALWLSCPPTSGSGSWTTWWYGHQGLVSKCLFKVISLKTVKNWPWSIFRVNFGDNFALIWWKITLWTTHFEIFWPLLPFTLPSSFIKKLF